MHVQSKNRFRIVSFLTYFIFMIFCLTAVNAQQQGHPYPRTAIFQWTGAPAEWYARFDLCMTRIDDSNFIANVKARNSQTIWLVARDFSKAYEGWGDFEDEWYMKTSRGGLIDIYGQGSYYVDHSDLCPNVNGKNFHDEYVDFLKDLIESSGADGIATDGLRSRNHFSWKPLDDVDIDRNGVNDISEYGNEWFLGHLESGVNSFLDALRQAVGDKIIIINGWPNRDRGPNIINGYIEEHKAVQSRTAWNYEMGKYIMASEQTHQPHIFLCNTDPVYYGIDGQMKNDLGILHNRDLFPFVRYHLGRSMLLGHYFEYEDGDAHDPNVREHFWNKYYDEFDLNVGYPTSDIQQVNNNVDGAWVRFFDEGAVIVNITGSTITVTSNQLSNLSGYSGPYYRFQGSQDPAFNNGTQFDQVELYGDLGDEDSKHVLGDAIVLVSNPQIVVSDIIIDNVISGTSPGSEVASFSSGWQQSECGSGYEFYTLRCHNYLGSYGYAVTSPGSGSETAVYRPTIGVAGNYEVFEWHGHIGGSAEAFTEATNVPFTIVHANGSSIQTVDLSNDYGGWNSLGTYQFTTGTSNYVKLSNNANGPVMADAVKFVFKGTSGMSDTTPPSPPGGVEVDQN